MSIKPELLRLRDKVKQIDFDLRDIVNSIDVLGNELEETIEELERIVKENEKDL